MRKVLLAAVAVAAIAPSAHAYTCGDLVAATPHEAARDKVLWSMTYYIANQYHSVMADPTAPVKIGKLVSALCFREENFDRPLTLAIDAAVAVLRDDDDIPE